MGQQQPQHRLPSYGRVDVPRDAPQPFRIVGGNSQPQPQQQQEPQHTTAELVHRGMLAYNQQYVQYHAEASSREGVEPEQIMRDVKAFDTKPIVELEKVAEDRVKQADSEYRKLVAAKAAAVDNDSYIRVRDRLHDRLSNSESPVTAAQDIIANAPPDELGVVLQEVKPWLENRNHDASFVETALKQNPSAADVKAVAETVALARQSAVIAHQTAKTIVTGIQNGSPARVLISPEDARKYDPDAAR